MKVDLDALPIKPHIAHAKMVCPQCLTKGRVVLSHWVPSDGPRHFLNHHECLSCHHVAPPFDFVLAALALAAENAR